jgi:hypothetical protein
MDWHTPYYSDCIDLAWWDCRDGDHRQGFGARSSIGNGVSFPSPNLSHSSNQGLGPEINCFGLAKGMTELALGKNYFFLSGA